MPHTSPYPRHLGDQSRLGTGPLTTTLEDIEDACRTAGRRGWTKAQIASELRTAGARWEAGKIVACSELTRGYLMRVLTVGQPVGQPVALR